MFLCIQYILDTLTLSLVRDYGGFERATNCHVDQFQRLQKATEILHLAPTTALNGESSALTSMVGTFGAVVGCTTGGLHHIPVGKCLVYSPHGQTEGYSVLLPIQGWIHARTWCRPAG